MKKTEKAIVTLEERKEAIKSNLKWGIKNPSGLGGQNCGIKSNIIRVSSDELGIEITVSYSRSMLENKGIATTLIDLAIDRLVI
jgi:protein subunit release factor A